MNIYRGDDHHLTDHKEPSFGWKPGDEIDFSGTIDKSGKHHTWLWVQIEEGDVISLFMGFLRSNPERLFALLARELEACDSELNRLRSGLRKVRRETTDEAVIKQIDSILNPD